QIDIAGSPTWFFWFGEFDNTPCENVTIEKCTFRNGNCAGIGTHSTVTGVTHKNIIVQECLFENLNSFAVSGQNWTDVAILRNKAVNTGGGYRVQSLADTKLSNITIDDNIVQDATKTGD